MLRYSRDANEFSTGSVSDPFLIGNVHVVLHPHSRPELVRLLEVRGTQALHQPVCGGGILLERPDAVLVGVGEVSAGRRGILPVARGDEVSCKKGRGAKSV